MPRRALRAPSGGYNDVILRLAGSGERARVEIDRRTEAAMA
jgi:hypothetical protein